MSTPNPQDPHSQTAIDILGPAPDHYSVERAIALVDIVTNKSRSIATRADALDELLMSWSPPASRDLIGNHVREQLAKLRESDAQLAADKAKPLAPVETDDAEITITTDDAAPSTAPAALADLLAAPSAP